MNCRTGNKTIWPTHGGECDYCSTSCICDGNCLTCEENCNCGDICLECEGNCNCGGTCLKCEENCKCGGICPICKENCNCCDCGENCPNCKDNCKCGGNCPQCDKNCMCNSSMSNYLVDFRIFLILRVLVWQDKSEKTCKECLSFLPFPACVWNKLPLIDGSRGFKQKVVI